MQYCPKTNAPALIFCCTPGCESPAFGCGLGCLSGDHADHDTQFWSSVSECVSQAQKPSLAESDIRVLEAQEKQLQICIGALGMLH